ncbi:hypothetical protein [Alkalihalobacillus sp. LMS39]|uniref:hypothetical protein n=1 Tax=Alkalihalobacillus sp. LMS39 TaxID=2924032 RepID=UPI001FB1DC62|nr:hypothetical protein [Alkalihalobacillus sp. LMS39]UOE94409.1 hypothetical protein MM271_01675 [Alkalihalobacillus sp. LMS39]
MSSKKIVFLIICSVAIFLMAAPYIRTIFLEKEELLLKAGVYEVGKDLAKGIYDIEAKDDVILQGKSYYKGGLAKAIPFQEGEFINIEDGSVLITKAKLDKLDTARNEEYIIRNSGFYYVGEQIEPGRYLLTFSDKVTEIPFVQTIDKNREVIQTFDLVKYREVNIELTDTMILQIEKTLFEEIESLNITLKKLDS